MGVNCLVDPSHGGFTGGEISYHVGSYWGIFIEEKMTQYIGGYIGVKCFYIEKYKKWSLKLMKKYKGV